MFLNSVLYFKSLAFLSIIAAAFSFYVLDEQKASVFFVGLAAVSYCCGVMLLKQNSSRQQIQQIQMNLRQQIHQSKEDIYVKLDLINAALNRTKQK